MHQAKIYERANHVQRRDAKQILDEFSNIIQWRSDQKDTLLDIGCGSGDVTVDYILPMMPTTFQQMIGVDISEKMVRHANEVYEQSRISFKTVDIGADFDDIWEVLQQKFDHIMSFYCLHWVQNLEKTMENVYNLLDEGGDCLFVFLASNPIFDVYKQLSSMTKWMPYMKDVSKFIAPYQHCEDADLQFQNLLYSTGFSDCTVELRNKVFIYDGLEVLRENVKAVNPFYSRMTTEMNEQFLDDYVKVITRMNLSEAKLKKNDFRFIAPYKLIVAYARK